jgi:hypothetical protein
MKLAITLFGIVGASAAPGLRGGPNATVGGADYLDCGSDVSLCAVLVLESGLGSDEYSHSAPVVHGLWPETPSYGSSACVAPSSSTAAPTTLASCYDDLSFEQHEWSNHGLCAGVTDATDFFTQICGLSSAPLAVMASSRSGGGDLSAMATALTWAGCAHRAARALSMCCQMCDVIHWAVGEHECVSLVRARYPVFYVDTSENSQVYLSACATAAGKWVISAVADFSSNCGAGAGGNCEPNARGPACTTDSDCTGLADCVRCASSGYCTEVPLAAAASPAVVA